MPRLIEPEGRTETVVDAMNYLLSRDGAAGLTLRSIARESRVSTGSLLHHYGSREHLVRIGANRTGRARLRAIDLGAARDGVAAFLPGVDDAEDLLTAGAWLTWLDLWRVDESLRTTIDRIRDQELMLLAQVLGVRLGSVDLTPLVALIDGLTIAVCAPTGPLAPARARELLRAHVNLNPVVARTSKQVS